MKLIITMAVSAFVMHAPEVSAQDYKGYNVLLGRYVTPTGVKYKEWAANKKDAAKLDAILGEWAKVDARKLGKNEQAAFRINLYNAAMIDVVLDRYPLKSVTKIGIPFSIFKKRLITTPSGKVSLDTLEKKILLRDFPDHRVHFAVNCASVSCPPLRKDAYQGRTLNRQLQEQAVKFANSSHAYMAKGGKAYYSELLKWYKKDFGHSNPAIVLNKYRKNKINTGLKVAWQKYDWNLNSAR